MIRALRPLALIGIPLLVVAGALMFWLKGGRYASTVLRAESISASAFASASR